MATTEREEYEIRVDVLDNDCLTLMAKEVWSDGYESDLKSMGEIIINAANYASSPSGISQSDVHWSYFDRPLWVEPRRPA